MAALHSQGLPVVLVVADNLCRQQVCPLPRAAEAEAALKLLWESDAVRE